MLGTLRIDGLVQERRNSSALAMELRLSYTNHVSWYYLASSVGRKTMAFVSSLEFINLHSDGLTHCPTTDEYESLKMCNLK